MRKLVQMGKRDPYMRDVASLVIIELPGKAFEAEIRAIFNFVRDEIRYQLDANDIEQLALGRNTLALGYGDCDDFCILLATLLECVGHPCRFVAMGFDAGGFSHVIVETQAAAAGRWIALDATEPNPMGWYPPGVRSRMVIYI